MSIIDCVPPIVIDLHPKFSKRHQQQQQQQQSEHHCFTTPSPSPPEHRINQLQSPLSKLNSGLTTTTTAINNNNNNNMFHPDIQSSIPSLVNQQQQQQQQESIFGKLLQQMTTTINPTTTTTKDYSQQQQQVLNETILQLAKINCQQQQNSQISLPSNDSESNSKALQLLNLLTKVNGQQNGQQNGHHHHQILSPIKSIHSTTNLLSPKNLFHSHQHLNHQQSKNLISDGLGHGLLLTTAPTTTLSSESLILDDHHHHGHRIKNESTLSTLIDNNPSTSTPSTTTTKYTRPFKALYNNKDLPLLSQKHSPSSTTTTTTAASSSSFPLENSATDSLLGSDQAYLMFRSQMLSMSKQRQTSSSSLEQRKSTSNRKSHNTSSNSSSKSIDITSDDNSSNSSLSAKRSRDLRRAKEDEIAIRASFLEHENRQLKLKLIEAELKLEKKDTIIVSLQNQLSSLK
ncbi:hypothetical protein DERP_002717 [Dermatophagoides pteronyssinus]|uniref:BZIP domain-containing protein n=1 Tax=Dermatophagoides pteronyssinus TaxID=6956 RepID=A0ABQ8JW21_DERPT|nr:hypothetical protein DERP_002717 [Dermatophagoides pteronyssinus]